VEFFSICVVYLYHSDSVSGSKSRIGIDHRSHQHMVPEAFSNELAK